MKFELHHHTLFSLNDGNGNGKETAAFCAEHGIEAIALTDHGHVMGHDAFRAAFADAKCPTKLIYGVEAYVPSLVNNTIEDDDEDEDSRVAHLVLLAKDAEGLKAINRMVTAGYANMQKNKPVITHEVIEKYCGEGAQGHGHVIALSACMQGVLSVEYLYNEYLERKAAKMLRKAERIDVDTELYEQLTAQAGELTDQLDELKERRQALNALKAKKFTARQRQVERLKGTPSYEDELKALNEEIEESRQAEIDFPAVKAEESAVSKQLTAIKSEIKKMEAKVERINAINVAAEEIRERQLDEGQLYENTVAAAQWYLTVFGEDFYAELQFHGIAAEAICFPVVANVAEELGIKVVATNDSHVLEGSEKNFKTRQILRSLRFNKWEEELDGDRQLYMKTDDEVRDALLQILPAYIVDEAIANTQLIADQCNVEFEEKPDHYPKFHDEKGRTSLQVLKDLCNEGFLKLKFKDAAEKKLYLDRVRYEVTVIEKLNVVDYLLIVQDFLAYGRLLGKIDINDPRFLADPYNIELIKKLGEGNVGMSIGIGRGSAVGSLVCYLIGITNADPIKYNLLFERFLNPERVTMPDIDSDFAPEIRGLVLNYVKHKYGEEAVCCIATIGTQGVKGAIRNCGRLLGDHKYNNPKELLPLVNDICAAVPQGVNVKFADCAELLMDKFGQNEDAKEILEDAQIVEGTFTTVGMHAAGVIIADNGDVGEYTALMKSKDGQWVSQCDMNYTESKGLLKMDFLGLNNLAIITETLRHVQKNYGVDINMEDVDLADAGVYENIFSKGNTDSVFQFESDGMKNMLQNFKPGKIEDIILLVAAYRPGPLQYLPDIIAAKNQGVKPKYIIPEMDEVLGVTYGKTIYQEQVMAILNKFAGFSLGESDIIRRYMSKKKADKMAAYEPKFIAGLVDHGATEEDAKDFWNQMMDFSSYAFNKSHACAYAITAYYTAWLKYHYPKEYLAAVANLTDFDKVSGVVADMRNFKIGVKNPDVNASDVGFSTEGDNVRYGLSNIKGVASAAYDIVEERANGPYTSFENFTERLKVKKDVLVALISAGALDEIASEYGASYTARRIALLKSVDGVEEENIPKTRNDVLNAEMKYLGVYLTENPASGIKAKQSIHELDAMVGSFVEIAGVVTDLEEKTSKSGSTFAVFKIVDAEYNSVDAVCYEKEYVRFGDILKKGICKFRGKVGQRGDALNLVVNNVYAASPIAKAVVLTPEKANYIKPYFDTCKKYHDNDGVELLFTLDGAPKRIGKSAYKVSLSILNDPDIGRLMTAVH